MNNITQIINALKPVAQKLGEGGQQLYRAYYRQTILNGVESLLISLLILVGLVVGHSYLRQLTNPKSKRNFEDISDEGVHEVVFLLTLLGVVIIILTIFFGIIPGLNDLINPNYQTIQNILRQI